jgi:hypothetical protein
MRPRRPPPRLRLHRETVRALSGHDLARAAGGTDFFMGGYLVGEETKPRSNAWTADLGVAALCGNVL